MIDQFEVRGLLEESLPGISSDLKKQNDTSNVYKLIHIFLDYTFGRIKEHNIKGVKQCFLLAEKIYRQGNQIVKCALESGYIYSFSRMPVKDKQEKQQILSMMPGGIYSLYMKQVIHTGI